IGNEVAEKSGPRAEFQHASPAAGNVGGERRVPLLINPPEERLGLDDPPPHSGRAGIIQIRPARERMRELSSNPVGEDAHADLRLDGSATNSIFTRLFSAAAIRLSIASECPS